VRKKAISYTINEMQSSMARSVLHFLLISIILTATTFAEATEIKTIGARFGIATAREDQRRPRGVFNPFSNQFLVTWDSKRSLRGRFINPDGTKSGVKQFFEGSRALNSDLLFNDVRRIYMLLYRTLTRSIFHELNSNGTTVTRSAAPYEEWIVHDPFTDKILAGRNFESVSLFDGKGTFIKELRYPSLSTVSIGEYATAEPNAARFFIIVQAHHTTATYLFRLDSTTDRFEGTRIRVVGVRPGEGVRSVHYNPITKELVLAVVKDVNSSRELSIVRIDSFANTLGRSKVGVTDDLTTTSILQIKNNLLISYGRGQQIYAKLLNATGRPLTAETVLAEADFRPFSQSGLLYSRTSDCGLLFWEFFWDRRYDRRFILGQSFRVS
jgi:hypothetical protein